MHQRTSLFRRVWPITLLGFVGVLSLLLAPVPDSLHVIAPEIAALPPTLQKGVLLINPGVLVLVASLAGGILAHRVGLVSVLAGTASAARWVGALPMSVSIGLALGLSLAAADSIAAVMLGREWDALMAAPRNGGSVTVIGMFYGGIAEEIMLRWGVMSLIAWGLVSLIRSPSNVVCIYAAIALAALIFGAGHLPALAAYVELTPAIVARTLLLNFLAGLVYGYLFWRYDLESAVIAHASTHLGFAGWRLLAA